MKKRDLVFLVVIFYLVTKVYVLSTPSKTDDQIPDVVSAAAISLAQE